MERFFPQAVKALVFAIFSALLAGSPEALTAGAQSSDLGFTYSVPNSWEVLSTPETLAQKKAEASQNAGSEDEKKGLACLEPVLTARDPKSGSLLLVQALPFDCFGREMTNEDIPGFAAGALEGLKQNFGVEEPVSATYALGTHSVFIERAKATLKGHPEKPFTAEIACSRLKKAAVCWMTVAGSDDTLYAFEQRSVTLDEEWAAALVPSTAFAKKPS